MEQVDKFRNDEHILRETVRQVQKDFSSCGIEIQFSENEITPYETLLTQVERHVGTLLQDNVSGLQNLLYRVDIPEKTFFTLQQDSLSFPTELSRLILEREFMKVVTRRIYKKQE